MTTLELASRSTLMEADEALKQFQRTMEQAATTGALNPKELSRFAATIREAAARVNDQVLPQIDAESANEISQRLITVLTMDTSALDVLDAADRYLMELEAIRHVLRDLLQEQQPEMLRRESRELIAAIEDWLPGVSVADRAELLGVDVRQLQRRRLGTSQATAREQVVTRLVAILRHAWTDAGVLAWFHRPRRDLGGETPLALLASGAHEQALMHAARAGRVQGGV